MINKHDSKDKIVDSTEYSASSKSTRGSSNNSTSEKDDSNSSASGGAKQHQWQNAENMRLLVSSIGYGVYSVDEKGICTFINKTGVELLGYDNEEELTGKFLHELIHHTNPDGSHYPSSQCRIYNASRNNQPIHIESEVFWRKNRSSFPVEYWCQPFAGDTPYSGCVVIFNDISDRLKIEAQKEHLIEQLEEKNAELERFLYTASHDLKSPLITIKGFAGALLKELSSDNIQRVAIDAQRILTAAEKMQLLIDDLLHFSHMGQESPVHSIALDKVIEQAIFNLEGIIAENHVELLIQRNLPTVVGNESRLIEVFQNLIENAIKFNAGVKNFKIQIGSRSVAVDQNTSSMSTFFVKDNGVGIEEKYFEKVFRLFERLDTRLPGSGVGLAIVKRIINQHSGKIWIESNGKNNGVSFLFTLKTVREDS